MIIVPSYAQIFPNLQAMPGWTGKTGTNIGGVAPVVYGMAQGIPGSPTAVYLWTEGVLGQYADVLWGLPPIPIPSGVSNAQMSYIFETDGNTPNWAQAIETDFLAVIAAQKFNGSLQINYGLSGAVQVGDWTTVATLGAIPAPNIQHQVQIQYSWTVKGLTPISYIFDGKDFELLSAFQVAAPSNWESGFYVQLQLDSKPSAGRWGVTIDQLDVRFW